ncbi:hypothetical protein GY45DRAFT_1438439 [Cubamyces sp. BRFM 1775]|nr:hypothetical protein GY45DRAFT_1438439 [Cubamyces sp. BRFM 1775]
MSTTKPPRALSSAPTQPEEVDVNAHVIVQSSVALMDFNQHILNHDLRDCSGGVDFQVDAGMRSTSRRLMMASAGVGLDCAESVNDLLKAIYDILEVHRTVASQRHVVHRDITLLNILMYPTLSTGKGTKCMQSSPLIDEILAGERSTPDTVCHSRGILIDFDHSAMLGDDQSKIGVAEELRHRTGTPVYIARAVATLREPVGRAVLDCRKMPTLNDQARGLYVKLHGKARYDRYTDDPKEDTFHRGIRPESLSALEISRIANRVPFFHHWRYDAESVFWALFSILLRVRPHRSVETGDTRNALRSRWSALQDHSIPYGAGFSAHTDSRMPLIDGNPFAFFIAFPPELQDTAVLLFHMSEQVFPSYAYMCKPPPHDDHLHEALQRLILNYLVEHEDNPIPLTPGSLRPVTETIQKNGHGTSHYSDMPDNRVETRGTKRTREKSDSEDPASQSARKTRVNLQSYPRGDDPHVF